MSRRILSQETCKALRATNNTCSVLNRCFATTSRNQSSSSATPGQGLKKRHMKEAKKKDDKLRHAINIFQLADWFFPTTAEGASSSSSSLLGPGTNSEPTSKSASQDSNTKKDELDELLDEHIRASMMGSAGYSAGDNFSKPISMQPAHAIEKYKNESDEAQYSSPYDAAYTSSRSNDSEPGQNLINSLFPPPPKKASAVSIRPLTPKTTDENRKSLLDSLPPVEDRAAVEQYVANTVKRAARIASQDRRRPSNLDARGAQVMDALYGTVGGFLPGLEVLKERVKEREEREKAEQQEQSQEIDK